MWYLLPGVSNLWGIQWAQFVQFSRSVMSNSFPTPWTAAHQASLLITSSRSLLKLMSIESVMPSNHLILCRPLLLLPSILPSIRVFSNESVLASGWQSIGASTSASILPKSTQDWFPLRLAGLTLLSKGLSRVFSSTTVQKHCVWSIAHVQKILLLLLCHWWWLFLVGSLISTKHHHHQPQSKAHYQSALGQDEKSHLHAGGLRSPRKLWGLQWRRKCNPTHKNREGEGIL